MTMKELFKKVETYNEIAEMMGTDKAKLVLTDIDDKFGYAKVEGSFKTYKEFTKFVKDEYFKDVAENLIKSKDWEMDGEITFQWGWNKENTCKYGIELAAI